MKTFDKHKAFPYLMEIYKMKLGTVSKALFVDETLISKWKNGKRKILPEYIDDLAEFFYDFDKNNGLNYLPSILADIFPQQKIEGKNAEIGALKSWFSGHSNDIPKERVSVADLTGTYQMFFGRVGILKAIRFLARKFSEYPAGSHFYCLNAYNVQWFTDINFQKAWTELLENLFENYGLKLRLINMMDWRQNEIRNVADTILYWDLRGWINAVFYTGTLNAGDGFVIIIPDFAVLRISADESAPDQILSTMFFDKFILRQQERMCEKLYGDGPKICDYDIFRKNLPLPLPRQDGIRFITNASLPIIPVDISELKNECGLSDKEAEEAAQKYPLLFIHTGKEIRYILNYEGLKAALASDGLKDTALSFAFGRDIILSRIYLKAQLERLKNQIMTGEINAMILNKPDYFPRFDIILDTDTAFSCYESYNGLFKSKYLIDFMNEYYSDKWNKLVYAGHTNSKAVKLLEKIIK